MKLFFKKYKLPKNLDILFLITLGIMLQMADGSPFSLKYRWILVWETELPSEFFSVLLQKVIKILLSAIVVVRCTTTYAYVVSAMLVIFCLVKQKYPKLMLLWLLVAGIKSISMTFLEVLIGVYVCSAFGKIHKACIEFFISKALELIFAAFLYGSVLNIYLDMERTTKLSTLTQTKEQMFLQKVNFRRQRARSMVDESTLYKTACLNNFEFKDIPQIILQMLRKGDEMSEDSLLGPGMMLASVSNLGSFDNLKTSQSLGELGFVDLETAEVLGLDEDEPLSYQEKALKFLKLTQSDVKKIKINKTPLEQDIFTVDKEIWKSVINNGTKIHKPTKPRNQIFIHDITQTENDYQNKPKGGSQNSTLQFNLCNLLQKSQTAIYEQELDFENLNEDDDDQSSPDIFMSNIKKLNNFESNCVQKIKKRQFTKLLKQDFMLVIGPEMFDRDPKLPKIPSLTLLNDKTETKSSKSLPALNIQNVGAEKEEKIYETSSSDLEHNEEDSLGTVDSSSGEKMQNNEKPDLTRTKRILHLTCKEHDTEPKKILQSPEYSSPDTEQKKIKITSNSILLQTKTSNKKQTMYNSEGVPKRPCYRKRRILIIIRKTKKKRRKILFRNSNSLNSQNSSKNSDECSDSPNPESHHEESKHLHDNSHPPGKPEKLSPAISGSEKSLKNHQTHCYSCSKQIYFLRNLFKKPFFDVLMTYYDLKKRVAVQNDRENLSKSSSQYPSEDFTRRSFAFSHKKVWKSKVLKTVELMHIDISPEESLASSSRKESLMRKLLKYQIASLMNKNTQNLEKRGAHEKTIESVNDFSPNARDDQSSFNSENEQTVIYNLEGIETSCETESQNFHDEKNANEEDPQSLSSNIQDIKTQEVLEVPVNAPKKQSLCSQDSDEPISLYYSKAADLASPLFDMKRFIYPDHIHYSYKHVKKKGFDVDINGDLPLLVRESLTIIRPMQTGNKLSPTDPKFEITRRPMDLSFAKTNAFAEWQSNEQNDAEATSSGGNERNSTVSDSSRKSKKGKRSKRNTKDYSKSKSKSYEEHFNKMKNLYSAKDYMLIEKLLRMHKLFNDNDLENRKRERKPTQISSTQLHSNKGSNNSTYNPAIFLQENRSRSDRRKMDSPHLVQKFGNKFTSERTKDMFARLEKEVLLQRKNFRKSSSTEAKFT